MMRMSCAVRSCKREKVYGKKKIISISNSIESLLMQKVLIIYDLQCKRKVGRTGRNFIMADRLIEWKFEEKGERRDGCKGEDER
jgi:hypothetical protein